MQPKLQHAIVIQSIIKQKLLCNINKIITLIKLNYELKQTQKHCIMQTIKTNGKQLCTLTIAMQTDKNINHTNLHVTHQPSL